MPDQVMDFQELFRANCAGCHGRDGRDGAARPLNDALYQAIVTQSKLEEIITHGVRRTAMPAFARSAGGELTAEQVHVLAAGMKARWAKPAEFSGVALPPYSPTEGGDAHRGEAAYQTYCARCHAESKGAPVLDPSYLTLASDQGLRSSIIDGPSREGPHDWRSYVAGRSMTPQEISDVVAYLASHRTSRGEAKQP